MNTPQQAIIKALFLGLDDLAPLEHENPQVAFLRAMHSYDLTAYGSASTWHYEQSFAPYANMLREAGYAISPDKLTAHGTMDRVLFAATRFAEENLATLARGWHMLKPGGWLIAAQHNDLGAKRLDATMKKMTPDSQSLSKFHCRAIAVQKTEDTENPLIREWLSADTPQRVEGAPLMAVPGTFSWRKVDAGSRLLIESLPKSLAGRGADIAAGWGYLSWALLESCQGIRHITLYEAEKRALDIAEQNLASHMTQCRFVWCDATRPLDNEGQGFDWAVMNPPAHDMLQTAPEATAAMFATAAKSLKQGGKLYLVANRHLPYERTLDALFSMQVTTHETNEYKIIEAVR